MKNYNSNSVTNNLLDVTQVEWSNPEFCGIDPKQISKNFYSNFSRLISQNGVSVQFLSKELSVAPSTIYHWKEGLGTPNYRNICKVAAFFRQSIGQLVSDDENGNIFSRPEAFNHQISFTEYLSGQAETPDRFSDKRTNNYGR